MPHRNRRHYSHLRSRRTVPLLFTIFGPTIALHMNSEPLNDANGYYLTFFSPIFGNHAPVTAAFLTMTTGLAPKLTI